MAENMDMNESTKWDQPSEADKELAAFVVNTVTAGVIAVTRTT